MSGPTDHNRSVAAAPSADSPSSGAAPEAVRPSGAGSILLRLGPTAVLGALWGSLPGILGMILFWKLGIISEWLKAQGDAGVYIYAGCFIVLSGIGVLPTVSQAVLGGWTFGFAAGFPAALAGFVGGGVIGYIIARTVSRDRVQVLIEENPKARAVRDALIGQGFWRTLGIVTLIRFPPNSPFALTNLALSASGVRPLPYIIGTAIGMAPRTAIAVAAAAAGGRHARDIQTFVKEGPGPLVFAAGLAVTLMVLAILGVLANRAIARATGRSAKPAG